MGSFDSLKKKSQMEKHRILFQLIKGRKGLSGEHPYVLFLGAGASLSSGASLFSRIFDSVGASNYEQFSDVVDPLSDSERYHLLHPHICVRSPSQSMILLAQMVKDGYFSIIVTTNFDSLIETAFQEVGIRPGEFQVIVNEPANPISNLNAIIDYANPRIKLLKLHGDFQRRSYALSQSETLLFSDSVENALSNLFSTRDVLLVGTKFADFDLLKSVSKGGGAIWSVNPSPPQGHLHALMKRRGCEGNCIDGESGRFDDFIGNLDRFLYQEQTTERSGSLTWHLYVPFYAGVYSQANNPFESEKVVSSIPNSKKFVWSPVEDFKATLFWFDEGTCVWHLIREMEFDSILEVAVERRRQYASLLQDDHSLCEFTRMICERVESGALFSSTRVGYALSIMELKRPAWSEHLIDNALQILCCPSVLTDSGLIDDFSLTPKEIDIENLKRRENSFLLDGVPEEGFDRFALANMFKGYASWAGVSWYNVTGDSETSSRLLDYECELQGCWWYLHHAKSLAEQGHSKFVKSHYQTQSVNQRLSRLMTIGPTEHTLMRRYKEAIIRTSRIEQLWSSFKELT